MLVYLKEPMGYSKVGDYRIYGEYFSYGRFGPADIPNELFKNNKNILKEGEYTRRWLEDKFGGKFPEVSFTISKMRNMSFETTVELAKCLGIDYRGRIKTSSSLDRRSLRRAIINKLTN